VKLRFCISLFSVGFAFTAKATYEEGKWFELRYLSGEPRDLYIKMEVDDVEDNENASLVRTTLRFDAMSLGWLAKFFLKHHPEIRFGVVPGSALVLFDGLRRVAEKKKS